jgi:hypothetical protein
MPIRQSVLLGLALAFLSGCFASDSGECFRPIDEFVPTQTPSGEGSAGLAAGGTSCAAWLQIGGDGYSDRYLDTRHEGWRFQLDAAELEPFAEATEATSLVSPVTEATVWSLRGLDSDDFVVMRSAQDGEFFFVVHEGAHLRLDVDEVLCRYATGLDYKVRERCGPGAGPSSADAP